MVDVVAVLGDAVAQDDPALLLARGLGDLGDEAVVGTDSDPAVADDNAVGGGPRLFVGPWRSGDDVADVLGRMEREVGSLHAVVLVSAGAEATEGADVEAIDPDQWRRRVERPLERTLACFQGTHRRLHHRGGCLVVLVPTLGLVGASGFVPWATVTEGQRALAKAAARAWGHEGIRVNCVAVPAVVLRGATSGGHGGRPTKDPDRAGQPPAALGEIPDLRQGVAPVVASLLSDAWSGVTGATIAVDGGVWMTP